MATALNPGVSGVGARATSAPVDSDTVGNDPSVPSAAYLRMLPRWTKCRACDIGTEAIRAGGTLYLPQYEGESDQRYAVRSTIAAFYNGYARTVSAIAGILLAEGVTFGADMAAELTDLAENIDAGGTHIDVFAQRLTRAGIVDSHAGILVEHSRPDDPSIDLSRASQAAAVARETGGPLDSSDEASLGLRPYFVLFRADDVIKAVYENVRGVRRLVLLILREVVSERVGKFGLKTVTRYRTYTNENGVIRYQLWKSRDASGGNAEPQGEPETITNQTEIPWSPFIAGDEISPGEYKPALLDLADLNIQYHGSLTNHLSLQSLAYVPTPVRIGAQPDADGEYPPIALGPRNTIEAPVTEGVAQPIYWLSPPVDVLDAGERTLQSTMAQMGTLGAAFLSSETRAAETAEGKRIDSAASRASIFTLSRALKDCLERAFGFAAKYRQVVAGSVTLNDDFTGERIDPTYLAVLVTAYQNDVITIDELRYVIKTGQLPEDFDPEDKKVIAELMAAEQARADAAKDALAMQAMQNGGGDNQQPTDRIAA
ncbi:MAG TPA: DUF4055 domain-containing protein [Vicinamibacterales bacterium]